MRSLRRLSLVSLVLVLGSSALAQAKVVRRASYAFRIEHQVVSKASAADLYRAFEQVGRWWSGQHTFSGKAENLSLRPEIGSCLCEKWSEGGVEHGRVIQTAKDQLLRLQAPLGPLLELPVSALLTFSLTAREGGTEVKLEYAVSGDATVLVGRWASPADQMLGQQLARLVRFVETGSAD